MGPAPPGSTRRALSRSLLQGRHLSTSTVWQSPGDWQSRPISALSSYSGSSFAEKASTLGVSAGLRVQDRAHLARGQGLTSPLPQGLPGEPPGRASSSGTHPASPAGRHSPGPGTPAPVTAAQTALCRVEMQPPRSRVMGSPFCFVGSRETAGPAGRPGATRCPSLAGIRSPGVQTLPTSPWLLHKVPRHPWRGQSDLPSGIT